MVLLRILGNSAFGNSWGFFKYDSSESREGAREGAGARSDVRNKAGAGSARGIKWVGARSNFGNGWSVER